MPIRGDNPFDDLEEFFERMRGEFEAGLPATTASISVDVEDRGDEFVVTADLPGFEKDEIEVTIADATLRIQAERETTTETDGEYLRRERHRESHDRSIHLPEAVDETAVEATHSNGVLSITLPKQETVGGTEIEIE